MSPTPHGVEPHELVHGLGFASDRHRVGTARLTLIGELDLVTASRAAVRIRHLQDESRLLICDLRAVWSLDPTGLRVLLDAAAYADRGGKRLLVANAPSILRRMLQLLELEHALEAPALPLRTTPARSCASFRPHVSGRAHRSPIRRS